MKYLAGILVAVLCSWGMAAGALPIDITGSTLSVESANTFTATNVALPGIGGRYWATFQWNGETFMWEIIDAGEMGVVVKKPSWSFETSSSPLIGVRNDQHVKIEAQCDLNTYHVTVTALRVTSVVPSQFLFEQNGQLAGGESTRAIDLVPPSSTSFDVVFPGSINACDDMILYLYGSTHHLVI